MDKFNELKTNMETCVQQGDFQAAVKISEEIKEKYSSKVNGYLYLLRNLNHLGLNDQKVTLLHQSIEKFPENLEINIQLSRHLFSTGQFRESLKYAQKIIDSIRNDFLEAYLISIKCLLEMSEVDTAQLLIDKALKISIDNFNLLKLSLDVYLLKNQFNLAEDLCDHLIQKFPDREIGYLEKIKLQTLNNNYVGILETASKAKSKSIRSFHIYIKASEAARSLFKRDLSLAYSLKVTEFFPDHSTGYKRAIDDLLWLCKFEECEEVLKNGLQNTNCDKLRMYIENDELKHRKKAYEDFILSGIDKQLINIEKPTFISIGPNCLPSSILNRNYLRKVSMPFDWLICPAEETLKIIQSDFVHFLDDAYLFSYHASHTEVCGHKLYGEKLFWHHNPRDDDDKQKFFRRIRRFQSALSKNEPLVLLTIGSGKENLDTICKLSELLNENTYILRFDLLNYDIELPILTQINNVISIEFPQKKHRSKNILNTIVKDGYDTWQGSELFDPYQSQLSDIILRILTIGNQIR